MLDTHALWAVAVMAAVTLAIRVLPFVLFREKQTPAYIRYLGKVLPYAMMAMLVIYCLKGMDLTAMPFGLPELVSVVLVAALHVWKRNTLLSIIAGTACYMVLIRLL